MKIKTLLKEVMLFLIGGLCYFSLEMIFRGYSDFTMIIVGGMCFVEIGLLNEFISWNMSIIKQMIIGAIIVTINEFISGIIINVILGLNVWDYSNIPFNIMGQICLPFTILWFFMSFIAIFVDDEIRYILFEEEKPQYNLLTKKK